jgi:hypothetical protein
MLSNTIASSEDLTLLTKVLDDHCRTNRISVGVERDRLARQLIDLFGLGVDTEIGLKAGLEATSLLSAKRNAKDNGTLSHP